jgi:hypothetical protein
MRHPQGSTRAAADTKPSAVTKKGSRFIPIKLLPTANPCGYAYQITGFGQLPSMTTG